MTTGETKARATAHVVVLGTGGTISGRARAAGDNVGYTTGEVEVSELIDGLEVPGVALSAEHFAACAHFVTEGGDSDVMLSRLGSHLGL